MNKGCGTITTSNQKHTDTKMEYHFWNWRIMLSLMAPTLNVARQRKATLNGYIIIIRKARKDRDAPWAFSKDRKVRQLYNDAYNASPYLADHSLETFQRSWFNPSCAFSDINEMKIVHVSTPYLLVEPTNMLCQKNEKRAFQALWRS